MEGYRDEISEQEFGVEETSRTLTVMHQRAFQVWMQLTLDQQRNDFERFLRSAEGSAANLTPDRIDAFAVLAPVRASLDETALFVRNLAAIITPAAPPAEAHEAAVNRSPAA